MTHGRGTSANYRKTVSRWHAIPAQDALRLLGSSVEGLGEGEARERIGRYGENVLIASPPEPAWRILFRQLRSVVVLLLVVGTLLALWTGSRLDASAIFVVLVLNVGIGFTTEFRARRAMEALVQLAAQRATVVRDGSTRVVDARTLVPGDLIVLEAGQAVPADARLLAATELETVEAALTGESEPAAKDADVILAVDSPLPDRQTMVFRGTTAASGVGRAVVVATGMRTEVGRIGTLVSTIRDEPTVIERKLDALGRRLAVVAVLVAAVVAVLELLRGAYLAAVLKTGIAVAIAAVPEGLPAVVTVAMAIAARRMARRHALVRHLPAVETLGSVTVVCTDKTGTLTAGRQSVTTMWLADGDVDLNTSARLDGGDPVDNEAPASNLDQRPLSHALVIAALANRAQVRRTNEGWDSQGDPTEIALLTMAHDAGVRRAALLEDWPEVGELPFSSARMMMATFHRAADGGVVAFVKGAHDRVLARCDRVLTSAGDRPLDAEWRHRIEDRASGMASQGLRVLALASGRVAVVGGDETIRGLRFAGLVGLADPVAPGVVETVATLREAGIRTLMLTGDHSATAWAVARDIGLLSEDDRALDGRDIDAMSDDDLQKSLGRVAIVSRVSPEGKLRVVAALQRNGEIVAMLGDGVNDAAALKKADIGVVMGRRGSEAAKEVAGIILGDDRFQTIAAAVEEGRAVFDNIRKFVFYLFSCNLAEILVLLAAGLGGLPLPMTPLQILWLNLATDTFPALALGLEPGESNVLRRPPRDPKLAILSRHLIVLTLVYSLLISAVTLAAFVWGLQAWPDAPARAVTLSFTTLAFAQLFHLGNARSTEHVVTPRRALANRYALAALGLTFVVQVLAVVAGPLARVLGTVSLPALGWAIAISLGAVPGIVGQTWKTLGRSNSRNRAAITGGTR